MGSEMCIRDRRGFVQVRAHGAPMAATISHHESQRVDEEPAVWVDLDEPTTGIAPGQAVVLYDEDRVVGSATIDTAVPA